MDKIEFLKYLKNKCNIQLTEAQNKAVFTIDGAMLILAVPGAGKTTVLCIKVANLILNHGISAERILVMTFSKASALDMKKRFLTLFGEVVKEDVKFSTIHSFAYSVLRDYSFKNKIRYKLIEGGESAINKGSILRNLYKEYNEEQINEDKMEELVNYIGYIKNMMISFNDLPKYARNFPVPNFEKIYKGYEEIKKDNYYIDFDDMIVLCYDILMHNNFMLDKYRKSFDYMLIDEAQDTSKLQHCIAKLLVSPKFNICLVGDDDQNIYSFRAADPKEILDFKKTYRKDGTILFMEQNFRSTKSIVSAANSFIKSNKERYNKNMLTENEEGPPIKFLALDNEFEQTRYIINELSMNNNLKETAILFRTNLSAVPLVDKLLKAHIPFYIKDSVPSFFNNWITKDIISFFRFSKNLNSIASFEKIYYKIKSYVQKKDIQNLIIEEGQTVFEALIKTRSYSETLLKFQRKFMILSDLSPRMAIEYIENELNYKLYLKSYAKKFGYSMESIDTMVSMLKTVSEGLENLEKFEEKLSFLQNEMMKSKGNIRSDAVTLSTLHSAKGLEYTSVWIIDLIEGLLPSSESLNDIKEGNRKLFEEETRLMYVGITRAKKNLELIYPKTKNSQKCGKSRYFAELFIIVHPKGIHNNVNSKTDKITKLNLHDGMNIKHKTLGTGEILKTDEATTIILFDSGAIKNFSTKICLEKKFLELI